MQEKNKGGRPCIQNRNQLRSKRLSFAVTPSEIMLLKARFRQAGKSATEYCREAVLTGEVHAALSKEERYVLMNLHKLGLRVNQLFIQGGLKRDVNARKEYDTFCQDFKSIKDYFHDKFSKR